MVNAAQDGLPVDPGLLKSVTELTEGALGVVADVEQGGVVTEGAAVVVR